MGVCTASWWAGGANVERSEELLNLYQAEIGAGKEEFVVLVIIGESLWQLG
jgi:hypothetical protein